jgi:hypothetical protein
MLQRNLLHCPLLTMQHLKLHYLPRMTLLMMRRKMRPHLPLRMLRLLPLVLRLALLLV